MGCLGGCNGQNDLTSVDSGQQAIDDNTPFEIAIDRNVVTTNTFLTTQTYDITGTSASAAPEPSSWGLILVGMVFVICFAKAFTKLS